MFDLPQISLATWAEVGQFAEFLSPLLVALFAVWLGFRYQRYLADRAEQRSAFLDAFETLGTMLDAVGLQESLRFATHQLEVFGNEKSYDKRRAVLYAADDRLTNLAVQLGFPPSAERPKEAKDGSIAVAGPPPVLLTGRITAKFNEAQVRLRHIHLRILMADPGAINSRIMVVGIAAMGRLEEELSIAYEGLQSTDVRVPDWAKLTSYYESSQVQVFRLLGGGSQRIVAVRQYRENLPWPEEIRSREPVRLSDWKPPTLFEGPSAIFFKWRKAK